MAEQQDICLLALKIAKVFLDGFELCSMYVGCLQISNGQRRRRFVGLFVAALENQVQKQGTVCAVFI